MLDNYLLYNTWPCLDLHGYDRESARVAVEDFIRDNVKMKNEYIAIIHGIGTGLVKDSVLNTLKKNKYVKEYKLTFVNPGMTVVKLDVL